MKVNREYKDSVFSKYFSEDTRRLIELYNTVSGEDYPLDTEIELNTLDGTLFKDRMNDISFLLGKQLVVLMEHQSTINKNMPLRMLSYVTRLYEKIVESESLYSCDRIMIPTPKFFVFYNGEKPHSKVETYRLSSSFMLKYDEVTLDLAVKVYNINYDIAIPTLKECKSLREYSYFVHCAREALQNGLSMEEAVTAAIRQCIRNNVMREFLEQHGSEVENMLYAEWNMDTALAVRERESHANAMVEVALQMLRDGESAAKVCKYTGLSEAAVSALTPVVHGGPVDDRQITMLTGVSIETIEQLLRS